MTRRRAVRLLLGSIAAASLFGCDAGNDQSASPVVASAEPVVSTSIQGVDSAVVASREVLSVTVAALSAPATTNAPTTTGPSGSGPSGSGPSTTLHAPTTAAALPAEPAGAPSFAANEMQLAPTTTKPPTTTVTVRYIAPATTATPPAFEPAASPIPLNAAAANEFQSRTNSLRASLGLGALSRNAQLDAYAASWARELAAAGKLSHSTSPEAAIANGWNSAGENVGFGASVGSVQDALVSSAGHYANLARPSYSAIGVAVAVGVDGRLWVCEVFAG